MAKKSGSKKGVRKVARSAITGRFVKKSYAKKHPKTTVVERIKPKPPSSKSKKK